jgi:hypothetical protein
MVWNEYNPFSLTKNKKMDNNLVLLGRVVDASGMGIYLTELERRNSFQKTITF